VYGSNVTVWVVRWTRHTFANLLHVTARRLICIKRRAADLVIRLADAVLVSHAASALFIVGGPAAVWQWGHKSLHQMICNPAGDILRRDLVGGLLSSHCRCMKPDAR